MSMPLTPYQRIMRAANEGRGIRLSALEVRQLSLDDAIQTVARNDDDPALCEAEWQIDNSKRMTP